MIDFNQAKQKVAERWCYRSWDEIDWYQINYVNHEEEWYPKDGMEWLLEKEVFEYGCNEAVKADRKKIRGTCIDSKPIPKKSGVGYYWIFNGQTFQNLPLPFPES